jgi:hypothetical protein
MTALETLNKLPKDLAALISKKDWDRLSKGLPDGYGSNEIDAVFFPEGKAEAADGGAEHSRMRRARGFLQSASSGEYRALHGFLVQGQGPGLCFVDVDKVLRITKQESQALCAIMEHVVSWMDETAAEEVRRATKRPTSNKGLIRAQLGESLTTKYEMAESRAITLSIRIQEVTLDYAHDQMAALKGVEQAVLLQSTLSSAGAAYGDRFRQEPWAGLLRRVRDCDPYLGELRPEWVVSRGGDAEEAGTEPPPDPADLGRAVGAALGGLPWVAMHPALSTEEAMARLRTALSPVLASWVRRSCLEALAEGRTDEKTRGTIQATLIQYGVDGGRHAAPPEEAVTTSPGVPDGDDEDVSQRGAEDDVESTVSSNNGLRISSPPLSRPAATRRKPREETQAPARQGASRTAGVEKAGVATTATQAKTAIQKLKELQRRRVKARKQ